MATQDMPSVPEYERRWKVVNYFDQSKRAESVNGGWPREHWTLDGNWHEIPDEYQIAPCVRGYHSSRTVGDCTRFVDGNAVLLVEVDGDSVDQGAKSAHRRMRAVRAWSLDAAFYKGLATFLESEDVNDWMEAPHKSLSNIKRTLNLIRTACTLYEAFQHIKPSAYGMVQLLAEQLLLPSDSVFELSAEQLAGVPAIPTPAPFNTYDDVPF